MRVLVTGWPSFLHGEATAGVRHGGPPRATARPAGWAGPPGERGRPGP